jgi:3' terminal RNA ribose 2'-O-methyltransferase Hen1
MLLTITTTHGPATDLGYLLEKHPARFQRFDLSFGCAHVFYPVVSAERCTAALLLELDPVGLVRGRRGGDGPTLGAYVNDRPYVASSFLSVAIAQVFGSALNGRSRERPELAASAIPFEVSLSALRCRGGQGLLERLFEPLGYQVVAEGGALDDTFPDWGPSAHFSVTLRGTQRLSDLLSHLYVLIPVLDSDKHYFVGADEVEKLLAKGEGWLGVHPERELIVSRFLKHRGRLMRDALERLRADEEIDADDADDERQGEEHAVEAKLSLNEQRLGVVIATLKSAGARRVIDLGCGEGNLLRELMRDREFTRIVGMDVSAHVLEWAKKKLGLEDLPERQRERIELLQSSLIYRDERLAGFDAACVVEVIEHLELDRLPAFERVLFEFARPATVIVTTPNVEYNVKFESLPRERRRHRDHRFEWTRAEFQAWATRVAERFRYTFRLARIGSEDPIVGAPTQMAVFSR